jgi:flagellar basal body-associated protein FliL
MGDTEEPIEDIEGTAEEEEAIETGRPRRRLLGPPVVKTLIYVAAALVIIIVSATVAYMVARRVGTPSPPDKTSSELIQKQRPLMYFNLEDFSINTSDSDEPHFVKIQIELGYDEGNVQLQTELNKRRAQLRDTVISIVGAKKYIELNTQDKRDDLKEEIKRRINDILMDGKIKGIAFTEFVLT